LKTVAMPKFYADLIVAAIAAARWRMDLVGRGRYIVPPAPGEVPWQQGE
jgi:hypothetical protein